MLLKKKKYNEKYNPLDNLDIVLFLKEQGVYDRFSKECMRLISMTDYEKKQLREDSWDKRALEYKEYSEFLISNNNESDVIDMSFDWHKEIELNNNNYIDWDNMSDLWRKRLETKQI